jgi:hypothetical protein
MSMTITFDRWHAQLLLEALRVCDKEWLATIDGTDDEDVHADYDNDRMRLQILQEAIEHAAVKAFGPDVKEFSRVPIAPTPPKASGF